MADSPLIGIFTHPGLSLGREVIRGITTYNREHAGWRLYLYLGLDAPDTRVIPAMDGAFIGISDETVLGFANSLSIPVVNVTGRLRDTPFPRVCLDDEDLGYRAGVHLLEKGFQHLALFATHAEDYLSHLREQGMARACNEAGNPPPEVYCCGGKHDYWPKLRAWLEARPPNTAIFAESDYDGGMLRQACQENGQDIPHDIAILGMGNDDLLCEAGNPELSSIAVPMQEIGYRAAEWMGDWLRGTPPPVPEKRFPGLRIIERGSTDVTFHEDARVVKALRLIKERACTNLSIDEIAREAGINRRSLEIKLKDHLGRTPHQEVVRLRMRQACIQLETTRLSVEEISQQCGYEHTPNFCRNFKDLLHTTPGAWRKQHQLRSPV